MPGGLLQLVSSGTEDKYLTALPEITFFKSVYRRHTIFALEMQEIDFDIEPNFASKTSLIIPNRGDLVYRMYLKIKIPRLSFTSASINNEKYKSYISSIQNTKKRELDDLKIQFTNLSNYAQINLNAYKIIIKSLKSDNINLSYLKLLINKYKNLSINEYKNYLKLIESTIIEDVDLISFISGLTAIISPNDLKNRVNKKYNNLIKILKKYYTRYNEKNNEYQDTLSTNIYKSWIPYLGHYIVNNYNIEIGGDKIDSYSSNFLHIYNSHAMAKEKKQIYNKMIGNIEQLYKFEKQDKESYTLLIPLLFWFCLDHGVALPLVGLRWNDVEINIQFNAIRNLIGLENWNEEWKNKCIIKYYKENFVIASQTNTYIIITNKNHKFKLVNINYVNESDMIIYCSDNIYSINLEYHYPDLSQELINTILSKWGTIKDGDTEESLDQIEWNTFRKNVYQDTDFDDCFHDYHRYLNKDILLNNIKFDSASLLIEYVYLDNMERNKFANSNLEYIIQQTQENVFDKEIESFNNCDLNFSNPIKELYWFVQPINIIETKPYYNIPLRHIFKKWNIYSYNIISKVNLELNYFNIFSDTFDAKYFQTVIPYKYLINQLPDGVNYYSFALYPEESQPSGTCNFSTLKGTILKLYYNEDFYNNVTNVRIFVLARNYNILNINKGRAKLLFY